MRRTDASQAARNDLATLGDKLLQQAHVFVINLVNFLDAKPADLFAAEKLASAIAAAASRPTITAVGTVTTVSAS